MTKEVHEIPIVITPPWINKFYILDLKPKKSFVLNLVSQGYTVFVISWKNPTKEMRNTSMDDYLSLGPLKAIEVAKAITKSKQVHAVGYCIGGTLLASAMASLNHPDNPQNGSVKDWTLLTTLVEFERPGELGSFITEESLEYLEEQMSKQGYLEGSQMGNTMRMLRPDGLIWHYFVNNYLFGKQPLQSTFFSGMMTPQGCLRKCIPSICENIISITGYANPMNWNWEGIPSTWAESPNRFIAFPRKRITSPPGLRFSGSMPWSRGRCVLFYPPRVILLRL